MKPHQDPNVCFVVLGPALCKDSLCGPVAIVLNLEDGVVVYATGIDELPADVISLTDYDSFGVRLIKVPLHHIDEFLTGEEAYLLTHEIEHADIQS